MAICYQSFIFPESRLIVLVRHMGYLEIPVPDDMLLALDMRRGVRVNYTTKAG